MKLEYLEPKWGGSVEEMVQFGREMGKKGNWAGGMPLALDEAHWRAARDSPGARRLIPDRSYFNTKEVWSDLQPIYEEQIRRHPDSRLWRTKYMLVAAYSEHWDIARDLLEKMKGDPSNRIIGDPVKEVKKEIEAHAPKAQ
jgi:hypothetical protein